MSSYYCLGYKRKDGCIYPMPRGLRHAAARIEKIDRASFALAKHASDLQQILIRPFLQGETGIQQLINNPIREGHIAMLCYLAPDGGIERKPITAEEKARWENCIELRMEIEP